MTAERAGAEDRQPLPFPGLPLHLTLVFPAGKYPRSDEYSQGLFKCLRPQKTPAFMIRPVPPVLPEGNEIARRKRTAEKQSLSAEEAQGWNSLGAAAWEAPW